MRIRGADISVIIPTYNRSAVITRAITSVQNQTILPREIIVVDDGSTDSTANQISKGFPTIKFLQQENQGVSSARNHGIQQSKGNWVALLDSDDTWDTNKLAAQITFLNQNPTLNICHTDENWIRNGQYVNQKYKHAKPNGDIYKHCLPLCCVSPSSILLHKDVLTDVGLFDETLPACEDYDLWLRIFYKYPIGLIEKPLVTKYGGHCDQLSKKHWGMDRFRIKALIKQLASNQLSKNQKSATVQILINKCKILAQGAKKRGKHQEENHYITLIKKWSKENSFKEVD